MKKGLRFHFLSAVVLLVLVFSAVHPLIARADDSTPPPPDSTQTVDSGGGTSTDSAPASQPTDAAPSAGSAAAGTDTSAQATNAAPTDTTVAPSNTPVPASTAAATDTSAPATTAAPTDAVTATDQPTDAAPTAISTDSVTATDQSTDTDMAPTAQPTDTSTATDAAATPTALPDGTSLVVLDATGTAVPLATQQAANILANGDPYFTYSGSVYGFTSAGSCPGIVDFCITTGSSTPIQDAINYLSTNNWTPDDNGSGNHNVYVEAGNYAEDVTINGSAWSSTPSQLGLIGAGSGSTTLDGYIEISNMNDFTLQGFDIYDANASGNGTYVYAHDNNGTLQLSDVSVTNSDPSSNNGDGIRVTNHTGHVHLTDVQANWNANQGAEITNDGNVTVDTSLYYWNYFENNAGDGLSIDSTGDVSISNVDTSGNAGDGLYLFNDGNATLSDIQALDNGSFGAQIAYVGGDANVDASTFGGYLQGNGDSGLVLSAHGNVSLSNVNATSNGANGADIFSGTGTVTIDPSYFDYNWNDGLDVTSNGFIYLTDVFAENNGQSLSSGAGAVLDNSSASSPQDVTLDYSSGIGNLFNYNYDTGLEVFSKGNISLYSVTADSNGHDSDYTTGAGAYLDNTFGSGYIYLFNYNTYFMGTVGEFSYNYADGLDALSNGIITLFYVNANDNGNTGNSAPDWGMGAYLDNTGGSAPINVNYSGFGYYDYDSSTPYGNYSTGLDVFSNGDITLNGVFANDNGWGASDVNNGYGAFLENDDLGATGNVYVTDYGTFGDWMSSGNYNDGLHILSNGDVSTQDLYAGWNGNEGAYISNGGDVTMDNTSTFYFNGLDGLSISSDGDVSLTDMLALGNHKNGAIISNDGSTTIDTNLWSSNQFNDNGSSGGDGLNISSSGDVSVSNTEANYNGLYSGGNGFNISSDGNVSLSNVVANSNNNNGALIDNHIVTGYSVTVDHSSFINNGGYGLSVSSAGVVSLSGVDASDNGNYGASIDNSFSTGYSVKIDPSTFDENGNYGLSISSAGVVALSNVDASDNGNYGASIDNTSSTGYSVTIDPSYFEENGNYGLSISSAGVVSLSNVNASKNGNYGASIDNTSSTGYSVTVDPSTFNGNSTDGLYILSAGDVSLSDVTANSNHDYGTYLNNISGGGDVSVNNSNFDSNTSSGIQTGLDIHSSGDVSLNSVSASNNMAGDGADVNGSSPVGSFTSLSIQNSTFNNNYSTSGGWGWGVYASNGAGDVTLLNVIASGNSSAGTAGGMHIQTSGNVFVDPSTFNNNDGNGLQVSSGGNVTVDCSNFENNGGYGLSANLPGTLTLNGDTFSGNASGNTNVAGGGTLVFGGCGGGGKKKPAPSGGSSLPWHDVTASDGEGVGLDCSLYRGTVLALSDRDQIVLPCPIGGNASLQHVTQDNLPGKLDAKYTFVSAHDAEVTPSLNGTMLLDFVIPSDQQNANLTILHWDGSKWVDMGGAKTADGFFGTASNLTGVFVLVTK